jgi:hypothetical protein
MLRLKWQNIFYAGDGSGQGAIGQLLEPELFRLQRHVQPELVSLESIL